MGAGRAPTQRVNATTRQPAGATPAPIRGIPAHVMGSFDQSVPHVVDLAHRMGRFDRRSHRAVEVAHLVGIAAHGPPGGTRGSRPSPAPRDQARRLATEPRGTRPAAADAAYSR